MVASGVYVGVAVSAAIIMLVSTGAITRAAPSDIACPNWRRAHAKTAKNPGESIGDVGVLFASGLRPAQESTLETIPVTAVVGFGGSGVVAISGEASAVGVMDGGAASACGSVAGPPRTTSELLTDDSGASSAAFREGCESDFGGSSAPAL